MVKRYEDWPLRLSNFLIEHRNLPFSYGTNDCLQFVGKAVFALTGADVLTKYGCYSTKEEADIIIKENGGIRRMIKDNLGNSGLHIMKAKRGDVCLVRAPEITACVVDDSGKHVVVVAEKGLIRKPLKEAICFWSV